MLSNSDMKHWGLKSYELLVIAKKIFSGIAADTE